MNARYYDPETGRFISEDSYRGEGEAFWHLYAYCNGDPVNFIDPTGHRRTSPKAIRTGRTWQGPTYKITFQDSRSTLKRTRNETKKIKTSQQVIDNYDRIRTGPENSIVKTLVNKIFGVFASLLEAAGIRIFDFNKNKDYFGRTLYIEKGYTITYTQRWFSEWSQQWGEEEAKVKNKKNAITYQTCYVTWTVRD